MTNQIRSFGSALLIGLLAALPAAVRAQDAPRARIDITVERADLSFPELQRLIPALEAVQLPEDFVVESLQARGPVSDITLDLLIRSSDSRIEGTVTGDFDGPQFAAGGMLTFRSVNLARLLQRDALPTDLSGSATFDLAIDTTGGTPAMTGPLSLDVERLAMAGYAAQGVSLAGRLDGQTLTLERARARAYGGRVTASGEVGLPLGNRSLTYTLEGTASRLDVARLPGALDLPDIDTNLDLSYRVQSRGNGLTGRARVNRSTVAGGTITAPTVVTFDTTGREVVYTATGGVEQFNPRRVAQALGIEALAEERFDGEVTGTFTVEGRGSTVGPLELSLTNSRILGGRLPRFAATMSREGDGMAFTATGRFEELAPGVALQDPDVDGTITGTLDISGSLEQTAAGFSRENLALNGRVQLEDGRLEGIPLDTLRVSGRYADSVLALDTARLDAPELTVNASGTLAFDGTTASNLTYFVDAPRLGAFRDLLDRPVSGDVTLEGRITGVNVLQVAGTLTGSGVGYGDVDMTSLDATYDVAVPPDDPSAAAGTVTADTALLRVAGRTITEATVSARYEDREAAFDLRVLEADRTITSQGRVVLWPDRQEIVLAGFRFEAPGAAWELTPNAQARIDWSGSQVAVHDVRLQGPSGLVVVDGALGETAGAGPLEVWIEGVSLASLDTLVFGEQGIAGQVDGYASVTGTFSDPRVSGRVEVADGRVRGYTFQHLSAAVEPAGDGDYRIDARLLETPTSWLTAEGRLPGSFFGGDAAGDEEMDIAVSTDTINLGFVNALTDAVANVRGTLVADVRVRGTLDEPYLDGQAAVRGGAFSAPELGTAFTNLEAAMTFERDAMVLSELTVLDENGEPLRASGRLPYTGGRSGAVTISVQSENFEIVDNDLGDVQISTSLDVSGTLLEPRLQGLVRVDSGELRVDNIMDLGDSGLYRAAPLEGEAAAAPAPAPGVLRDLPVALDVTLQLPALELTGRDLRGPASVPVGLGNVNIVVEGDLQLQKASDAPLRITGDIVTTRGIYEFQGRRFEIVRGGRVRFPGLIEVNPLLDITAQRVISGVETQVVVAGTLRQPELRLASQPPIDEADILSLIIFNQPANELGATEQVSLGRRAAALATGFVTSQLTESLGDALSLDIFELDTGSDIEQLAPVLTVGEQFGERLFLRVSQGLDDEAGTQVAVEYKVTDWVRLQTSVSDQRTEAQSLFRRAERSALKLIFSFNY